MTIPTLSYAELEALHDILEAARCYWHDKPEFHTRAAETLRLANQAYWRLGEELPKSGRPSKRFRPVMHPSEGGQVDELVEVVLAITRQYSNAHDPWWADTVIAPSQLRSALSPVEFAQFTSSLQRLGLTLELREGLPSDQLIAARRDWGPWPEYAGR